MVVPAVVVVDRDDFGVLALEDRREAAGGFVDVGGPEGAVVVVGVVAGHARVLVSEILDLLDAEQRGGPLRLAGSTLPEGIVAEVVGNQAELATGGEDQDDTVPLGDGTRDRAAG